MRAKLRPHLTFANIVSSIALFVALGGGAYAVSIPRNSVGGPQLKRGAVTASKIKKGAVTSAKVKDRSLLATDFRRGQLPAGPRGATGPQGVPGTPATRLFAAARANGAPLSVSPGASVSKYAGQTGAYKVTFTRDVTNCVAVANIGESTGNTTPGGEANSRTLGHAVPSEGATVDVVTRNSAGALADLPFNVAVFC